MLASAQDSTDSRARVCLICVCLQAVSANQPLETTPMNTLMCAHIDPITFDRRAHAGTPRRNGEKNQSNTLANGPTSNCIRTLGGSGGKSPSAGHGKCMGDATDVRRTTVVQISQHAGGCAMWPKGACGAHGLGRDRNPPHCCWQPERRAGCRVTADKQP